MTSYVWNGGNGDWNTATNWTPNGIPGAADSVSFATGGGPYTVTGNATVSAMQVVGDQVTFDGTITGGVGRLLTGSAGASVTIDSNGFLNGNVAMGAGTLLDVQGLLIDTGLVADAADVAIVEGSNAQLATASGLSVTQLYVLNGGTVAGDVQLHRGGSLNLDTSAIFGGSTLSLLGSGGSVYVANIAGQTTGVYNLNETISLSASTTTLDLGAEQGVALTLNGPITGSGNLAITTGAVTLDAVNTYTGFTAVAGASLTLVGQSAGAGPIYISDSSLTVLAATTGGGSFSETVVAQSNDTINAQAGNLLVFGPGFGGLHFYGGADASTVIGGSGAGNVLFGGSSGGDVFYGGIGLSTMVTGANGGLIVESYGASNTLIAGGGNSTLDGGQATGSDRFYGAASGHTTIDAGQGTNVIYGGAGADTVVANTGLSDIFVGTGGTEIDFVSGLGGATNAVVGFHLGTDHLHLSGFSAGEANAAIASAVVGSFGTELTLSDNTHIVLFGVTGVTASIFV